MNEAKPLQPQLDYRTGVPTFIFGDAIPAEARIASGSINRRRARGIQEALRADAPWKSLSADDWISLVARRAIDWKVPLISLAGFGFSKDDSEMLTSKELTYMSSGREAMAWLDRARNVVYKLFDVRGNATLGYKLSFTPESDTEVRIGYSEAVLSDTLDKLCILHDIGACPTEIIGLSENGKYLIVKQPRCPHKYKKFEFDSARRAAVKAVQAVTPRGSYGNEVWVFWADEQAWCLGDLHERNLMKSESGEATIIDALVAPVPPLILETYSRLSFAVRQAKALREGREPESDDIAQGVPDDEL